MPKCGKCGGVIKDGEKRVFDEVAGVTHFYITGCIASMRDRLEVLERDKEGGKEMTTSQKQDNLLLAPLFTITNPGQESAGGIVVTTHKPMAVGK